MDELRAQPTRRRILDEVAARPGSSGRDLQRRLALGWGETAYHLERLVKAGALRRERGGGRDYYFAADISWEDRRLFEALRSPTERAIVIALARAPGGLSFAEAQEAAGVGKSSVSYHLAQLAARGAIDASAPEGLRRYRLLRPARVEQLLQAYRTTFADRLVDEFVASFSGLWTRGSLA